MVLEDAQDLVFRSRDVISAVLVDGEPTSVPAGTVAVSSDDVAQDTLNPLEGAIASVDFVRILLWVVAAVIIGVGRVPVGTRTAARFRRAEGDRHVEPDAARRASRCRP